MKFAQCFMALVLCLCLCGCDFMNNGSHVYVQYHEPESTAGNTQNVSAETYQQLYDALARMIEKGTDQQIISVERYDKQCLEADLDKVSQDLLSSHPIAAYAVQEIRCTVGTVSGGDALSVQITYLHDEAQIRQILRVEDAAGAGDMIAQSLNACDPGVVLYIQNYAPTDFTQIVENYAMEHPEYVMEQPQVAVSIYPETGDSRVVEIKFAYHTSRESLKNMQNQVSPVFRSAVLYVSGDAAEKEKYSQLYSFLMERYDYTIETSITPTYSLLRHGAGDCRAFATVYAAMCRQAGLDCQVVSGNRSGENWYWNIVCMDGVYFHVDLLSETDGSVFLPHGDAEMRENGYLWDFDAYPACPQDPKQDTPEENIEN